MVGVFALDQLGNIRRDRVIFRNFEGKVFEYPEAADGTPVEESSEPDVPVELTEPELA